MVIICRSDRVTVNIGALGRNCRELPANKHRSSNIRAASDDRFSRRGRKQIITRSIASLARSHQDKNNFLTPSQTSGLKKFGDKSLPTLTRVGKLDKCVFVEFKFDRYGKNSDRMWPNRASTTGGLACHTSTKFLRRQAGNRGIRCSMGQLGAPEPGYLKSSFKFGKRKRVTGEI